ncbi:hypothetical protein EV356DRAFT_262551 [Viridothelium virens]|uniref:Uncharacterized protein n=1 Tax=Viridothelium virens TaxID=1048519 RepID=A0A6A6HK13_VIRVR|nr:hypothetical protein EV356DRAFT_262551 [Viridothelium virens]
MHINDTYAPMSRPDVTMVRQRHSCISAQNMHAAQDYTLKRLKIQHRPHFLVDETKLGTPLQGSLLVLLLHCCKKFWVLLAIIVDACAVLASSSIW